MPLRRSLVCTMVVPQRQSTQTHRAHQPAHFDLPGDAVGDGPGTGAPQAAAQFATASAGDPPPTAASLPIAPRAGSAAGAAADAGVSGALRANLPPLRITWHSVCFAGGHVGSENKPPMEDIIATLTQALPG